MSVSEHSGYMLGLAIGVVRFARRAPGLFVAAVCCWSVALAVNGATLRTADSLLFRAPVGVRDAAGVRRLYVVNRNPDGGTAITGNLSFPQYESVRRQFVDSGTLASYALAPVSASVAGSIRTYQAAIASTNLFELLGVVPRVGRLLVGNDSVGGSTPPVVISARVWTRDLNSSRDVIGTNILLRGKAFSVVGVAPEHFNAGEPSEIDVWIPLQEGAEWIAGPSWRTKAQRWWLAVIARVPSSSSVKALELRATAGVLNVFEPVVPDQVPPVVQLASLLPSRGPASSLGARAARWTAMASLGLLMVATINVAGLFVLRRLDGARDLAIKRVLGAQRKHLVGEMISELVAVGAMAGVLSVPLSFAVEQLMRGALVDGSSAIVAPFDMRALGIQVVALLGSLLVAMILPVGGAMISNELGMPTSLRMGSAGRTSMLRASVLLLQTAAATILLSITLLMARGLQLLGTADLGVVPKNVYMLTLESAYIKERGLDAARALERVRAEIERLPGVRAASVAIAAPFHVSVGVAVNAPDHPEVLHTAAGTPYLNAVTPDYFRAIGTRLLRGRAFESTDVRGAEYVAIINETLARDAWPGLEAIGRCLVLGAETKNPCYRVIGIARDARRFSVATEEPTMQVYIPIGQNIFEEYHPPRVLLVRFDDGMEGAATTVAKIARNAFAPEVQLTFRPLVDVIDPEFRPWRNARTVFGMLGLATIVACLVGLYGAIAYAVKQRTRDAAIRLALGARQFAVAMHTGRVPLMAYAVGMLLGVTVMAKLAGRYEKSLPTLSPVDVYGAVTIAVAIMMGAVIAAAMPLRRVARLQIADILRGNE